MKKKLLLFLVCIAFIKVHAQPANDICQNAIEITSDLYYGYIVRSYEFDNTTATTDNILIDNLWGADTIHKDIWFVFNCEEDTTYKLTTCYGNNVLDTRMAIYEVNDCQEIIDFSEFAYNDDRGCSTFEYSSTIYFFGKQNKTYYVRVGSYSEQDFGIGELSLTIDPAFARTINDSCHQAINLTIYNTGETGASTNISPFGNTATAYPNFCVDRSYPDIWFKFNSENHTSIWPRVRSEDYNYNYNGLSYFFDVYTDCNTLDTALSNQCGVDYITGFEKNTDYWLKMSWPRVWHGPWFTISLFGNNTTDGITENTFNDFNLSPNPAKELVHIQLPTVDDYTIQLIDLTGKTLLKQQIRDINYTLPLQDYASGLYFIQVTSNGQIINKRLIVE